jgi:gas vesicle protein
MKRNLLIGIIGGAAIGAAASYLLDADNRRGLSAGLSRRFNNLMGSEEEEDDTSLSVTNNNASSGRSATSGRAGGSQGGTKKRGIGRRG